jgi:hypothetical protein
MLLRLLRRAIPTGPGGDRLYAMLRFREGLGHWPKLDPPRTFNEHFLHQKLNFGPHLEIARRLTDKVEFKQWLHEMGQGDLIVPTLGVYQSPAELQAAVLPAPCVVKPTHRTGKVMFVGGTGPRGLTRRELATVRRWFAHSTYERGREPNYRGLQPRVIAEAMLPGDEGRPPVDYKFFCVRGEPFMIQVDVARFERPRRRQMVRPDWAPLPFVKGAAIRHPDPLPRPPQLDRAIALCRTLGSVLPLCRVDLYFLPDGSIRAGEITSFPGNCSSPFVPHSADLETGRQITRLLAQRGAS